ncbi:MAG TPA: hypothetical protein VIK74_04365, partial [Parasegetibacter sp.]
MKINARQYLDFSLSGIVFSAPRWLFLLIIFLVVNISSLAQEYHLEVRLSDKDTSFLRDEIPIQRSFPDQFSCRRYVDSLKYIFHGKGYAAFSIDSSRFGDSSAFIEIYAGEKYKWGGIYVNEVSPQLLQAVGWTTQFQGINQKQAGSDTFSTEPINRLRNRILDHLENQGYPFASVYLDSIQMINGEFSAKLKVDSGRSYTIDSFRIFGNVNISPQFLHRYLDIPPGSPYNKSKLSQVSKKLRDLSFLQEQRSWELAMLNTGSVLDLYLASRKSSQVNVLIGFLPSTDQLDDKKLMVTGEANINLKNALGQGEAIGLNWQQLQVNSPRLNIAYQHPYIFNSDFGFDGVFDLFKKDSTFLNLNARLGVLYLVGANETGQVFFQTTRTNLLQIDTLRIISTKTLPPEMDMSVLNLGIEYDLSRTDYRFNPRKGNELNLVATAGNKTIRKNTTITSIKDPGFNYETLY